MKRTIPFRRQQEKKMKKKAYRVFKSESNATNSFTDEELWEMANKRHNDLKGCSCSTCCNKRRSNWLNTEEKKTLQERRIEDEFNQSVLEIYEELE